MKFEDVKMRADAQEDDESKGVIICDTPAQLESALIKRCQEQWEAGADKPQVTISVDMVMIEDRRAVKYSPRLTSSSVE